jgi:hypothetical protein
VKEIEISHAPVRSIEVKQDYLNPTGKKVADEMLERWKAAAIEPFADLFITSTSYGSTSIAALVHRGKFATNERPAFAVDIREGAGLYWGEKQVDFTITFSVGVRYPIPGPLASTYRYYAFSEMSYAFNDVFTVLTTGRLNSLTQPFVL